VEERMNRANNWKIHTWTVGRGGR